MASPLSPPPGPGGEQNFLPPGGFQRLGSANWGDNEGGIRAGGGGAEHDGINLTSQNTMRRTEPGVCPDPVGLILGPA